MKTKVNVIRLIAACVLLNIAIPSCIYATEETCIRLEGKKLIGLPKKYEPAELDLVEGTLRIKNRIVKFSEHIQAYFEIKEAKIKVVAVWDYAVLDSEHIPHIIIKIIPRNTKYHYELMYNLDTLELMRIYIIIEENVGTRILEVHIYEDEMKEINSCISEI